MLRDVIALCDINSYTFNIAGVDAVIQAVIPRLKTLTPDLRRIDVPPARVIDNRGNVIEQPLARPVLARVRPAAKKRVLLNIHADTVYPPEHPFQKCVVEKQILRGPGTADAKGGLVILLNAVERFEQSPLAKDLGWDVLINTDEEIGSPGSRELLESCAKQNQIGLLFEPALPGGALVSQRKGSGTFTIVVRGRSAHAGRDFVSGRNAAVAAAEVALLLSRFNKPPYDAIINVGAIVSGDAANVVPDVAILRINCRASNPEQVHQIQDAIFESTVGVSMQEGYSSHVHGFFASKPKQLDPPTKKLLETILAAGATMGLKLRHAGTGGASDGNKLASMGLPNIDSLGPRGGGLHSPEEFIEIDSLPERAELVFRTLCALAAE